MKIRLGLSKPTFLAWKLTCRSLAGLAIHLMENHGLFYVLLGQIQSDPIESRFGIYRLMAGANYWISPRQLFESERKLRALSLVKFSALSLAEIESLRPNDCPQRSESAEAAEALASKVCQTDLPTPDETDCSAIYYVTGALVKSEMHLRKNCVSCADVLLKSKEDADVPIVDKGSDASVEDFVRKISRGGLLYPSEFAYGLCLRSWQAFCQLRSDENLLSSFLSQRNQESCFTSLVFLLLEFEGSDLDSGFSCERLHPCFSSLAKRFFRCLIKNLMKKLTADAVTEKKNSKRKRDNCTTKDVSKIRKLSSLPVNS